MPRIGYHASHEQFAPEELLGLVRLAEAAGFAAAKSSDHFHPWSERQGQSGFAWSWGITSSRKAVMTAQKVGVAFFLILLAMCWAAIFGLWQAGATLPVVAH